MIALRASSLVIGLSLLSSAALAQSGPTLAVPPATQNTQSAPTITAPTIVAPQVPTPAAPTVTVPDVQLPTMPAKPAGTRSALTPPESMLLPNLQPATAPAPAAPAAPEVPAVTATTPAALSVPAATNPAATNNVAVTSAAAAVTMTTKPSSEKTAVTTAPLENPDPDSVGVLTPQDGGLGLDLWKGTPRAVLHHLLPEINGTMTSSTLYDLARRLLLSLSKAPGDAPIKDVTNVIPDKPNALTPPPSDKTAATKPADLPPRSLTSMRVDKLLALGDAAGALQLSNFALQRNLDNDALRQVAEIAMLDSNNPDVCSTVPNYMKANPSDDWQRLLIICQLKDQKADAAQLGLDTMREKNIKDDLFVALVERVSNAAKQLPRQLTPLRAPNLTLMQMAGMPLPVEYYTKQDPAFIPALLAGKSADAATKLGLAERAAARGQIDAGLLRSVYEAVTITPEQLANIMTTQTADARNRATLVQMILKEKDATTKLPLLGKLASLSDATQLTGTYGKLFVTLQDGVTARAEPAWVAAPMVRALLLAGRGDLARPWLDLLRTHSATNQNAAQLLQVVWPLLVVNNLLTAEEFTAQLAGWQRKQLNDADSTGRNRTGQTLALFAALGWPIDARIWADVLTVDGGKQKFSLAPAALLARYADAQAANRRGETVLISLLLAGNGMSETAPTQVIDVVTGLNKIGLNAEARALAREALAVW